MKFSEKIKHKEFWYALLKVAIPFFLFLIIFSVILNSGRDIIDWNLSKITYDNFEDGRWISFFGYKVVLTLGYALWVTNKNFK